MMGKESKRKNLGRGLSALLGAEEENQATSGRSGGYKMLPIEFIHPGRYQPRQEMDEKLIKDLSQSIREKGILQPLLVRRHPDKTNAFEIIAGERRWRAAQKAKQHEIPVIIKDFSDQETLEVALVENLQRQDLSALEEAEGYSRLMKEFGHTQENLARAIGKSRSHVANFMRLLGLPDTVKKMLQSGKLSVGHVRALLTVDDPLVLAEQVISRGLNVRQTELLAKKGTPEKTTIATSKRTAPAKDADTVALEKDLENLLGLKVDIKFYGEKGSITVHYTSLDQLDDIVQQLSQKVS